MPNMVENMYENGVVEEDEIPWETVVVLSAKPHRENFPWHEYQWGMCVSYQKLNQVTCPVAFPIPRCDNAVQNIDTEANYFIAVDM